MLTTLYEKRVHYCPKLFSNTSPTTPQHTSSSSQLSKSTICVNPISPATQSETTTCYKRLNSCHRASNEFSTETYLLYVYINRSPNTSPNNQPSPPSAANVSKICFGGCTGTSFIHLQVSLSDLHLDSSSSNFRNLKKQQVTTL